MTIFDEILEAEKRIRPYKLKTPLIESRDLSKLINAKVYLKMESEQYTGSFKARGSLNKLLMNHFKYVLLKSVLFILFYQTSVSQTIDLTTLYKCEARVLKSHNSNLYLGSTGIYIMNDKRWIDISSNIGNRNLFYVNNIAFTKTKIIIESTYGIYSSNYDDFVWKEHKEFLSDLYHLIEIKDAVYMICSSGIYLFDELKEEFILISEKMPVTSVLSATFYDHKFWITEWKSGVWSFSLNTKQWIKAGNLSKDFLYLYKTEEGIYVKKLGRFYKFVDSDSLNWRLSKKTELNNLIFEDKNEKIKIFKSHSSIFNEPMFSVHRDEEITNVGSLLNKKVYDVYYFNSFFIISTPLGIYSSENLFDDLKRMNTGVRSYAYCKFFTDGKTAFIDFDDLGSDLFVTYNKGKDWIDFNTNYNFPRTILEDVIKIKDDFHLITSNGYYVINNEEQNPKLIIDTIEVHSILGINDSTILIGTNKGIFKTSDKGKNWLQIYALSGSYNDKISSLKQFDNIILASVKNSILICSKDNGKTWKVLRSEKKRAYQLTLSEHHIYWYQILGNAVSTTDLKNWTSIPRSDFFYINFKSINGILIKKLKDGYIYMLKDNSKGITKTYFENKAHKLNDIEPGVINYIKFQDKLFLLYNDKIQGIQIK